MGVFSGERRGSELGEFFFGGAVEASGDAVAELEVFVFLVEAFELVGAAVENADGVVDDGAAVSGDREV